MAQDKLDSGRTCDLARHLTIPDARWRRYDSDRIASSVIYWCSQNHISSPKGAILSTDLSGRVERRGPVQPPRLMSPTAASGCVLNSRQSVSCHKNHSRSRRGSAYPAINSWVVSGQRLQGDLEQFHKRVVREWFVEQPHGPRDRRTTLDALVAVSGNEDERELEPVPGQLLLHVESVHTGHLQVRQDTVGPFRRRKVEQEQLAGGEGSGPHAEGANQALECATHRRIIVDNRDQGRCVSHGQAVSRARKTILEQINPPLCEEYFQSARRIWDLGPITRRG